MRALRLRATAALLLPLFAACSDLPTESVRTGEITGTVRVEDGRAALVLQVTPEGALDSLLVGPGSGPGVFVVAGPEQGRYLVLTEDNFAPAVRFRAFVNRAIDPAAVSIDVIETASVSGDVDDGSSASISFAR